MISFAVDKYRDLHLDGKRSIAMVSGVDALAATCTQVMSTLTGEVLFDTTKGVAYMDTAFGSDQNAIAAFIQSGTAALMSVKGVTKVAAFQANSQGQYVAAVESSIGNFAISNVPQG